mgnify:CR=1 FL=1
MLHIFKNIRNYFQRKQELRELFDDYQDVEEVLLEKRLEIFKEKHVFFSQEFRYLKTKSKWEVFQKSKGCVHTWFAVGIVTIVKIKSYHKTANIAEHQLLL